MPSRIARGKSKPMRFRRRFGRHVQVQPRQPKREAPQAPQEPQEQAPQEQEQEQEQEQAPQESSGQQDEAELHGEAEKEAPIRFPLVSSHVANGRLCTVALCITPYGCSIVRCRSKSPIRHEGPVRFGSEQNSALDHAVEKQRRVLTHKARAEQQKHYAGQLVERARQGDQNAMAIIALVRDNKDKELAAKRSFALMKQYIDAHPVSPIGTDSDIGDRYFRPSEFAWESTHIANGPPLTNPRIRNVASSFGSDSAVFARALRGKSMPDDLDELQCQVFSVGYVLRRAKKLQDVRRPDSRISSFSSSVGWELGE